MAYEELTTEMERQSGFLIQKTIEQVQQRPNLAGLDRQILERMASRHLSRMIEYVHTGDIQQWQVYLTTLGQEPLTKGMSLTSLMELGGLLFEQLISLIERTFNQPSQAHDRERYIRRLNGSRAVAQTTVIANSIKPVAS